MRQRKLQQFVINRQFWNDVASHRRIILPSGKIFTISPEFSSLMFPMFRHLQSEKEEHATTSSPEANGFFVTLLIVPLGGMEFGNGLFDVKCAAISISNPPAHDFKEIRIFNPLKKVVEYLCLLAAEETIHPNVGNISRL